MPLRAKQIATNLRETDPKAWTQKAVGALLGVDQTTVSKWFISNMNGHNVFARVGSTNSPEKAMSRLFFSTDCQGAEKRISKQGLTTTNGRGSISASRNGYPSVRRAAETSRQNHMLSTPVGSRRSAGILLTAPKRSPKVRRPTRPSIEPLEPRLALATTTTGQDGFFNYAVENNSVSIKSYLGDEVSVSVPATIKSLPVTSIGANAFAHHLLRTVTLPDSIKEIRSSAFASCPALVDVRLPAGTTTIGDGAFYACPKLSGVVLPTALKSIGSSAFASCTSLNKVVVPEGVTSIGANAFNSCTSLLEVSLPRSLNGLGSTVFSGCRSLGQITVDSANTSYTVNSGILYSKDMGALILCPARKSGDIVLPGTVKTLAPESFSFCTSVSSVAVPAGVAVIDVGTFRGCTKLRSVVLPVGIRSINQSAFADCYSLPTINIPSSVTYIGDGAFRSAGITSMILPAGITGVSNSTFEYCRNLAAVSLPAGIRSIGSGGFGQCSSLLAITVPEGVTSIGPRAFDSCSKLSGVTLPKSLQSIGFDAFSNCIGLRSINLPAGLSSIDSGAFVGCRGLTSLVVPGTVSSIGSSAFKSCTSLASVTIGEGVKSIGYYAFQYCGSLKSVTVPSSINTRIGDYAFANSGTVNFYFNGDAPTLGAYVFQDTDGTVFYKAGTRFWGASYGGLKTAVQR